MAMPEWGNEGKNPKRPEWKQPESQSNDSHQDRVDKLKEIVKPKIDKSQS
jgi:hypothetical protein